LYFLSKLIKQFNIKLIQSPTASHVLCFVPILILVYVPQLSRGLGKLSSAILHNNIMMSANIGCRCGTFILIPYFLNMWFAVFPCQVETVVIVIVWKFMTTYAINVYHHYCCEFEPFPDEVYSMQQYVIKLVSDF
jgi:hypothetical protein